MKKVIIKIFEVLTAPIWLIVFIVVIARAFKRHNIIASIVGHHGLIVGYDNKSNKYIGLDPMLGLVRLYNLITFNAERYNPDTKEYEIVIWKRGSNLDITCFDLQNTKKYGNWWIPIGKNIFRSYATFSIDFFFSSDYINDKKYKTILEYI